MQLVDKAVVPDKRSFPNRVLIVVCSTIATATSGALGLSGTFRIGPWQTAAAAERAHAANGGKPVRPFHFKVEDSDLQSITEVHLHRVGKQVRICPPTPNVTKDIKITEGRLQQLMTLRGKMRSSWA